MANVTNNQKAFVDNEGNEMSAEDLKAARKKCVQDVLAADRLMDEIQAELTAKLNEAKNERSKAIEALVETGVDKFRHPAGYVLTPSRKEKTKDGVPGIYFLRGKPKVETQDEEVFDLDE